MAIGVAVDILGCTGSVEERASTLNRIILVAVELKDTVGDLFAFTALMKALDMQQVTKSTTYSLGGGDKAVVKPRIPFGILTQVLKYLLCPQQISRLEETWTTLRRNYTQTAISYEKTLKPFYKSLYEGTGTETHGGQNRRDKGRDRLNVLFMRVTQG